MEIKELTGFVLLLLMVGMVLAVGVLVLDKFGTATQTETAVSHENITVAASASTLTYHDIVSISWIANGTQNKTTGFNVVGSQVNFTARGIVVQTANWSDQWYEITYAYDKNESSTDTLTDTRAAITPISTTWMSLIVTVVILSLILMLVIRSFSFGNRRD